MKNKKLIGIIVIFIFVLSIGYAILSANLNIHGAFNFQEASWNIYLDNIQIAEGSVEADLPVISDRTTIDFEGELSKPGEFYEFSVDLVNAGTIDAVINNVEKTALSEEQSKYLNYTARYYGTNTSLSSNYVIPAGRKERIIVRIEYKYDIEDFISFNNLSLSLSLTINQPNPSKEYKNIVYNFFSVNNEETFIAPKAGSYKLEIWGAQGGYGYSKDYHGGYGGYSKGVISLEKNQKLYINVGGAGQSGITKTTDVKAGGYNGGGLSMGGPDKYVGAGGGATHIATVSGLLSTLESQKSHVYIVAGGGGGGGFESLAYHSYGGSGGGIQGNDGDLQASGDYRSYVNGKGGTQESGGSGHELRQMAAFGIGAVADSNAIGGGGGYYGGGAGLYCSGGGGGSGYIGNTLLTNKEMYCYNCMESTETSTKTISTTNISEEPISQYAKIGNGFARITYIG